MGTVNGIEYKIEFNIEFNIEFKNDNGNLFITEHNTKSNNGNI